jgi:hypothetical protein
VTPRLRLPRALVPVAAVMAVFSAAAGAARASDDLGVEVLVDRPRPAEDDVVRLTYRFSGSGLSGDLRAPSVIPLKNLALAGGPSRSDSVSFVNGVFSRSLSLTYVLRPKGPGAAEVGETVWTVGDRTLKAGPYLLEVGPPRGNSRGAPDEESEPDPFGIAGPGIRPRAAFPPRDAAAGRQEKPLVELLVTPDKTTAYVGEEVTLHVELVASADVQGLEWIDAPKFPGLWAEDLERSERPVGRRDTYQGRPVVRFTLLKKLVSGLAPGTATIPPVKIRTAVRVAGDPFGDPFGLFFRPQTVELASKPVVLRILPIPGETGFKGPVGRFDLTARLDKSSLAVGEAATLKVRLSGSGNLRTVSEPPKVTAGNARLYPPTTRTEPAKGGHPTAIEWEYVVVPAAPGEVTIPPVSLEIFDPVEKRVVTRSTPPLRLAAEGAGLPPAAAAAGVGSPTPAAQAETTLPAEPKAAAAAGPAAGAASTAGGPALDLSRQTVTLPLWLLIAVPAALVVGLGGALLARRPGSLRAELKASLAPEPGETKERAAARLDRALRDGLAKKFGVPEGATAAAILATLAEKGVGEEPRREMESLLADLDFLRFAPQLGDYGEKIREMRDRAGRVLPKLL